LKHIQLGQTGPASCWPHV